MLIRDIKTERKIRSVFFIRQGKSRIRCVYGIILVMNEVDLDVINKNIRERARELLPDSELLSFLSDGSKKIRSRLALSYIKALNKEPDDIVYNILTAGELLHNASLLHDDVIDDSELRRGVTTIGKKYSPNISILCGDYVVTNAIELLLKLNNQVIFEKFNTCVKNMAVSEIRQYFMRNGSPSLEEYIEICKGKTAGLFMTILYCCALHLNIDTEQASKFGELFGIYFQIKNDLDMHSALEDKKNKIHTAADILGIENTAVLLDNYRKDLIMLLSLIPENNYKSDLEGIISGL